MVGDSVTQDIEGALRRDARRAGAPVGTPAPESRGARRASLRESARCSGDRPADRFQRRRLDRPNARRRATVYPGGQARPRPASRCRWMWNTVWPASRLQLNTVR